MSATKETDDAIRKFYRDLGYADKKSGKNYKNLSGFPAKWYKEGFEAQCPWWDVVAY